MSGPRPNVSPIAVIALVLTLAGVLPCAAQPAVQSFAELPQVLKPGTRVYIHDGKGERVKGKVADLSATSLELATGGERRTFAADGVTRITRIDSRVNGFVIGAVAGAVPGTLLGVGINEYFGNEGRGKSAATAPIVGAFFGLIGGGIGFAIDNLINGQTPVFEPKRTAAQPQVRVAPTIGKGRTGVQVSLRF